MSEDAGAGQSQFRDLINLIKAGAGSEVQAILQGRADQLVNRIESQFRQPPLYFAALANGDELSAQMIKLLMRYGANARFRDHNQQTILFYICREGKEICAQLLLTHGLSLDDVDIYGQTPMFYAISENRLEIVRKYATRQRINHVDKLAGQTPLYYASRRGHLEMCKLLIEKGANVTHLDTHNKTAIQYARRAKFTETADYLNFQYRRAKQTKQIGEDSRRRQQMSLEPKLTYKLVFLNEKGEAVDITEEEALKLFEGRPELKELFTNPDSISSEELASAEVETWQKIATRVLGSCSKLKGSYYFLQPVDPIRFNITDYFNIISNPMDLGTVKLRLLHNYYVTPQEFLADMRLIWQNSYKYNGDAHIVSKCAKELENTFQQLLSTSGLKQYLTPEQPIFQE